MALDARHRSSIYLKFVPLIGEDDANALMSEFPASEADELVTKQFLRAELALTRGELRGEMADLRDGLRGEMADLRDGLRGEMADLRDGLRGEMADLRDGLRAEMADLAMGLRGEMGELRVQIADLRSEVLDRFHQQTVWLGGAIAASTAVLAALTRLG